MKTCILKPSTKRLRQLIKECGNVWEIIEDERPVQCFNGELGLMIQTNTGAHRRWVRPTDVELI